MTNPHGGRLFRQAWIDGVTKHYPGTPKPGYIVPWDDTPEWERQAATSVYQQVHDFIAISDGHTVKLTREQKGRFVVTCWIAQIHKLIDNPKPAYVADWDQLPEWQRQVDADIFERIESAQRLQAPGLIVEKLTQPDRQRSDLSQQPPWTCLDTGQHGTCGAATGPEAPPGQHRDGISAWQARRPERLLTP